MTVSGPVKQTIPNQCRTCAHSTLTTDPADGWVWTCLLAPRGLPCNWIARDRPERPTRRPKGSRP